MEKKGEHEASRPPLMALNHVSRLCRDAKKSREFYTKVLGVVEIERPASLDFEGAWLFNYGVGIHLVQVKDEEKLSSNTDHLDPISFQCEDMEALEKRLKEVKVKYIKRTVGDKEDGAIDQLFFNDPDGFKVEICNCENLELVPRTSADAIHLPEDRHTPPTMERPGSPSPILNTVKTLLVCACPVFC